MRYVIANACDADANILGLSGANAAAALSGAFVVNGSPTQTAMAEAAAARGQIAITAAGRRRVGCLRYCTKLWQRCVAATLHAEKTAGTALVHRSSHPTQRNAWATAQRLMPLQP